MKIAQVRTNEKSVLIYEIINSDNNEVLFQVYLDPETEQIHLENQRDIYNGPEQLLLEI